MLFCPFGSHLYSGTIKSLNWVDQNRFFLSFELHTLLHTLHIKWLNIQIRGIPVEKKVFFLNKSTPFSNGYVYNFLKYWFDKIWLSYIQKHNFGHSLFRISPWWAYLGKKFANEKVAFPQITMGASSEKN